MRIKEELIQSREAMSETLSRVLGKKGACRRRSSVEETNGGSAVAEGKSVVVRSMAQQTKSAAS
jgi:hypothetical protein